jgi:VWFA-related protein
MSAAVVILATAGAMVYAQQTPQQTPRFQSSVDVVPVDVTVVDDGGRPVQDLTPADFTVQIDGQPRRVVSAGWISLVTDRPQATATRVPDGFTSNEQAANGRLIVLAVDQPNIPFTALRAFRDTLTSFLGALPASDRIAVIGFGVGAMSVPFTADRDRVKQAIAGMTGQQQNPGGSHDMGLATAIKIDRDNANRRMGDPASGDLERLANRDCPPRTGLNPASRNVCEEEIVSEARAIAMSARQEGEATTRSMQALLTGLKGVDAPKALILISQRYFVDQERDGVSRLTELGSLAAAARTNIFAVSLDASSNITQRREAVSPVEDRQLAQQGLQTLASSAGGAMFNLVGTGTGVFDRITSEMSGYYLLGVEPVAGDRDGKPHPISVDVSRRGLTVRARRTILAAGGTAPVAQSPRESVMAALGMPLLLSSLPLRAIAFALRGPDASKIQLLIHADIGSSYAAPARVSVAYAVVDQQGRPVDGQLSETRLAPIAAGVPSTLAFTAGASVDPGDYTIKIAVAEGDRIGSLELPIHAALVEAGGATLTELMVGGPVPPGDPLRPTIGARVSFGSVQGYLEAYGSDVAALNARFEIAADDRSPALVSADVPGRSGGTERVLFSRMVNVDALPPGGYRLRAIVSKGDVPIKTLSRGFDIGPVANAAVAEAGRAGVPSIAKEMFLPVDAKDLTPAFQREDALHAAALARFRDRLPAAAKPAFEEGFGHLQKGTYADAEKSFRAALRQDPDSGVSLAYLAAVFAAAGHDTEAAAAWQTVLARTDDVPELYEWLGDTLMRKRLYAEARPILEDAVERWPSDTRFARTLALLYAAAGQGGSAVQSMERFLAVHPSDARAHFLVLQWLFTIHRAGTAVHGHAEDLKLAREYAERYRATKGPNQALVKQWLEYLEKERP